MRTGRSDERDSGGARRAGYGEEVIERLAARLARRVGDGFGARTLRRIRLFYSTYPDGSAVPPELGGPEKRIVEAFGDDVPPMRTLQRRLGKLVADGTIGRRGSRKTAVYLAADESMATPA